MSPWVSASGLGLRRGDEWLFKGLALEVRPGQLVWLRGQNGRGKTSLLRLLAGIAAPDEGTLHRSNGSSSEASAASATGALKPLYIGHANGLKDDLTALEALDFLARLHEQEHSPDVLSTALRRLAIHHRRHRPVRTLSQGQRRRLALARLAIHRQPALWLLDEPFDSLDAQGIEIVNALLVEHLARGGSVVLTSHLPLRLPDSVTVHEIDLDQRVAPRP